MFDTIDRFYDVLRIYLGVNAIATKTDRGDDNVFLLAFLLPFWWMANFGLIVYAMLALNVYFHSPAP